MFAIHDTSIAVQVHFHSQTCVQRVISDTAVQSCTSWNSEHIFGVQTRIILRLTLTLNFAALQQQKRPEMIHACGPG